MPRLDNTSEAVIKEYKLKFDPEDPGERTVDLCAGCFRWGVFSEEFLIEHPPYVEGFIRCFECNRLLGEEDE